MISGRRMIVNSGRIVVDHIACFDNSYVLFAAYGKVTGKIFPSYRTLQLGHF